VQALRSRKKRPLNLFDGEINKHLWTLREILPCIPRLVIRQKKTKRDKDRRTETTQHWLDIISWKKSISHTLFKDQINRLELLIVKKAFGDRRKIVSNDLQAKVVIDLGFKKDTLT
jgi:hypothetical protein